jgi:hypothetical protein
VTPSILNDPPYFTTSPDLTILYQANYQYDASGTDPEAQPLTFALYGNCTSWLFFGASNGTVWGYATPVGWYYCNLSLSDGVNEVWQNWTLTVEAPPNLPPTFTSSPILTGQNITWYFYQALATDPENDPLVFAFGPNTNATFLNLNSISGMIYGTPTSASCYWVNVSVTDGVSTVWQNYTLSLSEGTPVGDVQPGGPFSLSIGIMVIIAVLAATMVMIWRSS